MGVETAIAWCDHTFNPWWGCQRVSPGCEHCYAEAFDRRVGGAHWGSRAERRFFGDKHWAQPLKWNAKAQKLGVRLKVFCASMADVFEDRAALDAPRERLARLIDATPWLDWLILTKRIENALAMLRRMFPNGLPRNVWIGCTVEDQRRADERIPHLVRVPAVVRFLSCEPLLERVDIKPYMRWVFREGIAPNADGTSFSLPAVGGSRGIDWVIIGGESGHGARRFHAEWARSLVEQCRAAGVPVFVKQMGANVIDRNDRFNTCQDTDPELADHWPLDDPDRVEENIDGHRTEYQGAPVRIRLLDKKGGTPSEWPPDLRVRQWPEARP